MSDLLTTPELFLLSYYLILKWIDLYGVDFELGYFLSGLLLYFMRSVYDVLVPAHRVAHLL